MSDAVHVDDSIDVSGMSAVADTLAAYDASAVSGMSAASDVSAVSGTSSYAAVSSRPRTSSVSSTTSQKSSDSQRFLASFDRMSNFEREHYHPNNILPSRPCSAFFHLPEKGVSTTDIFQDVKSCSIPVSSVRCLQRNPHHVFITFSTNVYRERFLKKSTFIPHPKASHAASGNTSSYVTVYDAPYKLPDPAINKHLSRYGNVISSRRCHQQGYPTVYNGIRTFQMDLSESVPSFLRFGRCLLRVWHVN